MTDRQKLKDEVYLKMAETIADLSRDEQTHIGCVIVASDGTPVSWGYNGTVSGFRDDMIPHSREPKKLHFYENNQDSNASLKTWTSKELLINKYPFMCHAEENAMDFGDNKKLENSTVYITAMPCGSCARQIAKKKISRVVVLPNSKEDEKSILGKEDDLAKFFFAEAGVKLFIGDEEIFLRN